MKKVIALIIAVAIVASMGVLSVLAADNHISADEIFGASAEKTDIGRGGTWGSVGGNTTVPTEPAETDMGDISDKQLAYVVFWGWYGDIGGIESFGYSINGGDPVYDASFAVTAEQGVVDVVSSTLGADAEASRFKIFVPTVVGKDVEITALAKNKDGDVSELWIATYTNTYDAGTSAPETPDNEPGNDEPNTSTADGTAIMFMVAAAAVVATVLLKKRAF